MRRETYTPNEGPWIELPAPTSRHWDFDDAAGLQVHDISPGHLAYWTPDVAARGFLFFGLGFLALAWLFGFVWSLPGLWSSGRPEGLPWPVYLVALLGPTALGPAAALGCWLCLRLPLMPPTYFHRPLQKIMHFQKGFGRRGEWTVWDWATSTAAIRQVHVYSSGGRSTLYALVLMQLDAKSNEIIRGFAAYVAEQAKLPAVQAWEYIRRYMNEPPERVPPAQILPLRYDDKAWAVRCQMETMRWGIDASGAIPGWFDRFYLPIIGTALYAPMWATLWIEKTAPKVPLPPDLASTKEWTGSQSNPYRIRHDYDGSSSQDPIESVYRRVRVRHWLMTALSFGFYVTLLLAMLLYRWSGQ